MYGQPPRNGGGGGGSGSGGSGSGSWRISPPQPQPQPQPRLQPQPPYGFQSPNFIPYPFFPNPNFPIQNPNFLNFPLQKFQQPPPQQSFQFQQHHPQQSFPRGNNEVDGAAVNAAGHENLQPNPVFQVQQQPSSLGNKEGIERVDKAVVKARKDLIEAGKNVTAWKVSQAALVILNSDTWDSLGFKVQEVPSLHSLIVLEGKVQG